MPRTLERTQRSTDVTRRLAEYASGFVLDHAPQPVVTVAKQCLLDWLGVTLAGAQEPLTQTLLDYVRAEGCGDHATLVGLGARASASQAALVNGAAGHALDYDDVLSMASGLQCNFGTMTKPFHAGWAARNAVAAVRLAQSGFSATPTAMEGKNGFFATYGTEQSDMQRCVEGLGNPYTLVEPGLALKNTPAATRCTGQLMPSWNCASDCH